MRILFCTGSPARYMAPPCLGDEQINCGPDWRDRDIGGHILSLATPVGDFDIASVIARLPGDQQPDAVVCLVDSSRRSMPRNLKSLQCPKVLLVADTHHLTAPITSMVRYAQSEPFDRVVLLYDRHHWEFFHAAGIRQLFWFPGLTFPHTDRAVAAARAVAPRHAELAFVGQLGICHPRRTHMLSQLIAHQLPVTIRAASQPESLRLYGRSLIGFNSSLNGDLNLRTFEILAGGAMLLTDQLGRHSGLSDLWQNGRELVTYASPQEMIERAKHALASIEETRAIADSGARWFDIHFGELSRKKAFRDLIVDGIAHPAFTLPSPVMISNGSAIGGTQDRLTFGYEYVQELHRNLDRVVVALDDSVPEEFVRLCATLPRIAVQRGLPAKGTRVDFLVVGKKNYESSALAASSHVWPWDSVESDRMALVRRCASMGLMLVDGTQHIFSRQRVNTHASAGAVALMKLEQGAYEDALKLAKVELAKSPKSVDALIVLCETAQESANPALAQAAMAQLSTLAPHNPRVRQILSDTKENLRFRRAGRLLRIARVYLEHKKWAEVHRLARQVLTIDPESAEANHLIGLSASVEHSADSAIAFLGLATKQAPGNSGYWHELGALLRRHGRNADAMGALLQCTLLEPENFEYVLALGETALAAGNGAIAEEALMTADRLRPGCCAVTRWLTAARLLTEQNNYAAPRDLLLSHVEVTRLQGTGVLLQRFFPDSSEFITLRSRTLYQGNVEFGGIHFSLDLPGLTEGARRALVQRLLKPYRIRRILCVPFFASDFIHALAAHEVTGAPLCTYVMDDQVLHAKAVSQELAQEVFSISDLRLAISPEMIADYSAWFHCSFGLLPPIVSSRENEVPNRWERVSHRPQHCAMVGNIWSANQFEQARRFARAADLTVDWFGNADVSWLPKDRASVEADGIFCRGFLAEDQLASRLAEYPFVLLPSGTLDGTEDNEWLTRLSLPSRMVFIVTKTQTPMLVLGSAKTAAARFVEKFGLGTSSNYDAAEAREKITLITSPEYRADVLANAQRVSPCFLMPNCGAWLWQSLAARTPLQAPFDHLFVGADANAKERPLDALTLPEGGTNAEPLLFANTLSGIVLKLGDRVLLDTYIPADEPRQKGDVRGAVWFLREALQAFGSLHVRLLAIERLSLLVPGFRAILVAWAELLEEAGDLKEAAEKARRALSMFYDDVYTQTLFMRCAGEVNHHANGKDLFCARPFRNFEIYEDGAVHVCNCTCVPFPVGNAITQTADEIWQSPIAKAIRASILDGSFRYCSPMTCPWRFALPKRSEQPEEFEQLKQIGIEGTRQKPQHLNLSYDRSCNLSCPSCRNQLLMANKEQRDKNERIRDRVVMPLLETAETVYITGSGDAFGSPHFRGILRQLCDPRYKVEIHLGTNGQLLTPRLWEEFQPLHARFRDIMISIDGATPETFERLRRGSTWEKLQVAMGILRVARQSRVIRRLRVNMVVQTENFSEMRPLLALCQDWAVDTVCFYRLRQWGNIIPGKYLASDIVNPLHPRHGELLQELAHPDFDQPIVDHYDMYELIARAQAGRKSAAPRPDCDEPSEIRLADTLVV